MRRFCPAALEPNVSTEISGQSSKRSRSRIRRFARKSSRFDSCEIFPSTVDGEVRAKVPEPDDRGPVEGTTRFRDGWAGGGFGGFVAERPGRARPTAEIEAPEAIVTCSLGVFGRSWWFRRARIGLLGSVCLRGLGCSGRDLPTSKCEETQLTLYGSCTRDACLPRPRSALDGKVQKTLCSGKSLTCLGIKR